MLEVVFLQKQPMNHSDHFVSNGQDIGVKNTSTNKKKVIWEFHYQIQAFSTPLDLSIKLRRLELFSMFVLTIE